MVSKMGLSGYPKLMSHKGGGATAPRNVLLQNVPH